MKNISLAKVNTKFWKLVNNILNKDIFFDFGKKIAYKSWKNSQKGE